MLTRRLAAALLWACPALALPDLAHAQSTWRVSTSSTDTEGNGAAGSSAISGNGRFVVFYSEADDLVPGDGNGVGDAFVRDRQTGTTTRVSIDSAGAEGNGPSIPRSISLDGRTVSFMSEATNLVPADNNGTWDCFVHDRQLGTTTRVSVDSSGIEGNAASSGPVLSADGALVTFSSDASNLAPADTNGQTDIFVHDRGSGLTTRVGVHSSGAQGDRLSSACSISSDGQFVTFFSVATNLVPGDTNGKSDVFVHELSTAKTSRVSIDSSGIQGDLGSFAPAISADGRFVAFSSLATNLSPDTNGAEECFVHDRQTGVTTRVSVDSSLAQANATSNAASISANGRFVAFSSVATNLVLADTNGHQDVFVHGPDLTLEASPEAVSAGDAVTLATWIGRPSGPALLALMELNGSPLFLKVLLASFDASGLWTLPGVVPPGLAGNVMTFKTLGFVPSGRIEISNGEEITFES